MIEVSKRKKILIDIFFLLLIIAIVYLSNFFFIEILIKLSIESDLLILAPTIIFIFLTSLTIFILYRYERVKVALDFSTRLRLKKLKFKEIIISLLTYLILLSLQGLLAMHSPDFFVFDSYLTSPVPIDPNIKIGVFISICLPIVMTLGAVIEELYWRGFILPLQEKRWGKFGWVLNGLFWSTSHFLVLNPLSILIVSLGISFIGHKYQNTSLTIVIHILNNLIFSYILLSQLQ
ncbi:CPBP family intramembrane glutamic endopeptidase [Maribacter sp. IgM3_T14_3]|uniref:CPBP family intramembrane glutamic endopeptidase n=1 Tax=Maribacter sp. IgM3_T14_3 TaxID=3415140 RepID=UPI003C6F058D